MEFHSPNNLTRGNVLPPADAASPVPRFSLIVATLGRTQEVRKLLDSILHQQYQSLEVIVVDQNTDGCLHEVLGSYRPHLNLVHLLASPGVSQARNLGLAAAAGQLIAFPDDDCSYSPNLLVNVDQWFQNYPQYAVFAVGAVDEHGVPSGNRWFRDACKITPFNSLRTTFCSSLFVQRLMIPDGLGFDEVLTRGEETDFVLRLFKSGRKGYFDRKWYVIHPCRDMLSNAVSGQRAFSYGEGMGSLAKRHSLVLLWTLLLAYDLGRACLVTILGRWSSASRCFSHAGGLFVGFVKSEN